jgi:amino acid transporter
MPWENSPVMVLVVYALIVAVGIAVILRLSKDKTRKISRLRLFIQIIAVVAVFMGLIIGPFGVTRFLPLGITARDRLIGADV